jgi:hypothetical protein
MIFTIRVYALWNRSRMVLFLCLGAATFNFGVYTVLVSYSTATGIVTAAPAPFTGCTLFTTYSKDYLMFVAAITFETAIIILTAIKSLPHARHTPLFTMVLRDGFVYYFSILALHILNLIILFTPSLAVASIMPSYPTLAVMTVACNRLLIRQQRMLIDADSETTANFQSSDPHIVSIALRKIRRHGSNPSFSRDLHGEDQISTIKGA